MPVDELDSTHRELSPINRVHPANRVERGTSLEIKKKRKRKKGGGDWRRVGGEGGPARAQRFRPRWRCNDAEVKSYIVGSC